MSRVFLPRWCHTALRLSSHYADLATTFTQARLNIECNTFLCSLRSSKPPLPLPIPTASDMSRRACSTFVPCSCYSARLAGSRRRPARFSCLCSLVNVIHSIDFLERLAIRAVVAALWLWTKKRSTMVALRQASVLRMSCQDGCVEKRASVLVDRMCRLDNGL